MRILNGEKPGEIKTAPSNFAPPRYDWRELRRWKINQRFLPPGAEIDFREPTTWETYRWQVIFIFAIVLAQAGLISLLLHERGRRNFAEVQSRQRMSELAHVNRYAMAGELTTSIAHEINQPLGAIRANAETMELIVKSASPDMDEIAEIASDIRRDEERASEVIGRLRSLLKKAPFELRELDFNEVVSETVKFLSALAAGRQVRISNSLYPASLPIKGDRIQLQQVILNLIVNAMDAMSSMPVAERHITVWTHRSDDFAETSISHTGPALRPTSSPACSSRFFRPNRRAWAWAGPSRKRTRESCSPRTRKRAARCSVSGCRWR